MMSKINTKLILMVLAFLVLLLPCWGNGLHDAAEQGNLGAVKKALSQDPGLINVRNEGGRTPLHLAAVNGHKDVVLQLIQKGADVNLKSQKNKRSPLHYAAWKGHAEVVQLLLKKGAEVDSREIDGETPLYYGGASGNLQVIKLLVAKGARVKGEKSTLNTTPLTYAVYRNGGSVDIVKFLIAKGADVMQAADNGFNLLHRAAWEAKGDMINLLIDKGIPVDSRTDFGRTPLQNAVMTGNLEAAEVLIKRGADVNASGDEDWPPLYLAVKRGRKDMVALLLKTGANANDTRKQTKKTVLHTAAIKGYGKIAYKLLEKGAEPNARDNSGITPLEYAYRYGHRKTAEILTAKGAKPGEWKKNFGSSPLLRKDLKPGTAIVWYLNHSGWAIKTSHHLLVFDYFRNDTLPDDPLLANGCINPEEIQDLEVVVFASHAHGDHFMPAIFDWQDKVKNITYIMGFKPEAKGDYIYLAPRQKKAVSGLKVATIESNDSGVGFFVKVDGVTIFHSGDHANRQQDFSGPFKKEIDFLADKGLQPDIFFAPVSGCGFGDLEAVKKGVYYTVKKLSPTAVFPMHAGGNEMRYLEFAKKAGEKGLKTHFCCARNNGDVFVLYDGKVKDLYAGHKTYAAKKGDKKSCKKTCKADAKKTTT